MKALALLAALAGAAALSANQAEAACNIRGEFCGYPAWASNAFAHPRDRVSEAVLIDNQRGARAYVRKKRAR